MGTLAQLIWLLPTTDDNIPLGIKMSTHGNSTSKTTHTHEKGHGSGGKASADKGTSALNASAAALGTSMDILSSAARDVIHSVDNAAKGVADTVNHKIDDMTKKAP